MPFKPTITLSGMFITLATIFSFSKVASSQGSTIKRYREDPHRANTHPKLRNKGPMDFELERNMDFCCANEDCHYWDEMELRNCGKEDDRGEPATWTCPDYIPREEP